MNNYKYALIAVTAFIAAIFFIQVAFVIGLIVLLGGAGFLLYYLFKEEPKDGETP